MNRADSLAKSMQESIQDYTIKLNKACNLVDYFITVGIEPSIALNQWLYNIHIETSHTVLRTRCSFHWYSQAGLPAEQSGKQPASRRLPPPGTCRSLGRSTETSLHPSETKPPH